MWLFRYWPVYDQYGATSPSLPTSQPQQSSQYKLTVLIRREYVVNPPLEPNPNSSSLFMPNQTQWTKAKSSRRSEAEKGRSFLCHPRKRKLARETKPTQTWVVTRTLPLPKSVSCPQIPRFCVQISVYRDYTLAAHARCCFQYTLI